MIPGFSKLLLQKNLTFGTLEFGRKAEQSRSDWSFQITLCNTPVICSSFHHASTSWPNIDPNWKWDGTFSPSYLSTDGTVWISAHWMQVLWMLSRMVCSNLNSLGWVSLRSEVRLTLWLHKCFFKTGVATPGKWPGKWLGLIGTAITFTFYFTRDYLRMFSSIRLSSNIWLFTDLVS